MLALQPRKFAVIDQPLILGHERSLTQIKFNKEGDLLFSCSKDHVINVWFTHNGERLGTYDGHNGTVWTIDVDCEFSNACPTLREPHFSPCSAQSRFLVSGSADNTLRLWDVQTGKCLYRWEFPTAVKRVAWSEDDNQVVCITEQRMGYQCAVRIFDIDREGDGTNRTLLIRRPHIVWLNTAFSLVPLRIEGAMVYVQPYWLESYTLLVCPHTGSHPHGSRVRQGRALRREDR